MAPSIVGVAMRPRPASRCEIFSCDTTLKLVKRAARGYIPRRHRPSIWLRHQHPVEYEVPFSGLVLVKRTSVPSVSSSALQIPPFPALTRQSSLSLSNSCPSSFFASRSSSSCSQASSFARHHLTFHPKVRLTEQETHGERERRTAAYFENFHSTSFMNFGDPDLRSGPRGMLLTTQKSLRKS